MEGKNKKIVWWIIGIIILLIVVVAGYFLVKNLMNYPAPYPLEGFCERNNGKWVSNFSECEDISKEICNKMHGVFSECESACRHDPNAKVCTMQCIPVCKFSEIVGNDKDEHGCIGSAGYSWCGSKQKCLRIWEENCSIEEDNFLEINRCIMTVQVDYSSNNIVNNEQDVEIVFNKFIEYSKNNNQEIFDHNAENYRFKSTIIDGTYKNKKYWKVTTEWYETDPEDDLYYQKWLPEEVFGVSENGEVVRLLGCI